ncbi:MAG TPA: GAF domain-containing sensor histidine kinase [Solirubrobacteraceae bacterium]|nr:GAF domain-containing sensor histidine kinase [Solirubrobacteraceae bacterium]
MASLLAAGRALVAELDPQAVLDRILSTAREVTGARYAALGILDEQRVGLEQFVTLGIDEDTRTQIGGPPRGRGVLGVLIRDPRPLRLSDVNSHPHSYGFPEGHPPMSSFLGVPIVLRGAVWGNLYLTEKDDGEFTEADEEAVVILADYAATAIENARLYQVSERRRVEQDRAMRGLEATRDIATAVGSDTGLDRVLELIVKRGRALVDARSVVILLREGSDLVVTASAGEAADMRGHRLPISDSTSGEVLRARRPQRIDATSGLRIGPSEFGVADAHTALMVPLLARGDAIGVLAAFDRTWDGGAFSDDDELLMTTFAASAANAVTVRRSVESERLRSSMAAADAERARWARELHDETLQGLGALRLLLSSARRRGDHKQTELVLDEAIEQIEGEIESLHAIISDLRPATLDELGLGPTLEALLQRRRDHGTLEITSAIDLGAHPDNGQRLPAEIETTVYRLVQEALTNIVKHAHASKVDVAVTVAPDCVAVAIEDDGDGFSTEAETSGFGLAGMRERVFLVGGTLSVDSSAGGGTVVRAELPTRVAAPPSADGQLAS